MQLSFLQNSPTTLLYCISPVFGHTDIVSLAIFCWVHEGILHVKLKYIVQYMFDTENSWWRSSLAVLSMTASGLRLETRDYLGQETRERLFRVRNTCNIKIHWRARNNVLNVFGFDFIDYPFRTVLYT